MYPFFFYTCLVMLGVSVALGIAAVWIPSFWEHRECPKLIWTSIVLFGASVAAALITKWLG